jgi:hypothetical protein
MLKWTWIMVVLAAGCSDPTFVIDVDPDEPVPTEETGETTGATDETEGTVPETTGSVSDTGSGSGSATVDTGSVTDDCPYACEGKAVCTSMGGTIHPEYGGCPALFCCELGGTSTVTADTGSGTVDTETGTGTGTGTPCTGTCANTRNCGGDWIKIVGDCPLGHACCVPNPDTGSATVDTDTNPQPCPTDDPLYSCEYRIHCDGPGGYNVDTDYYCADPVNFGCCRHPY